MSGRATVSGIALLALFALLLGGAREAFAAKPRTKKKKPAAAAAATAQPAARRAPRAPSAPDPASGVVDVSAFTGELPLTALGATVIDAWTGEAIYAKNADQPFFPASTTKILTALLVIEAGNLGQEVIIDDEAPRVGESSLQLKPGEHYTRREMLYGLMLKSANDVAYELARDNAGSIEAFAEKMNQRARELGATNSHFVNPHGLHNPLHYTTPHDLALIARAAMRQPFFREIVQTRTHPWQSPARLGMLTNHNRLLSMFPGCTGIKTGYTGPAGNVLVSSALWGTRELIAVVMHSDRPGQWADSKLLLSYGFAHLPTQQM